MNQSTTSETNQSRIKQAEEVLTKSISKFESVVEKLSGKAEATRQSIHHVLTMAETHQLEIAKLKDRAIEVIEPIWLLVNQVGGYGKTFSLQVKANPKRYFWSFMGIFGGLMAWKYFEKENSKAIT
jgi:hypothetical protein